MKIWKFGGSSVASPARIKQIGDIFAQAEEKPRAVVFSAFGGVTDALLELLEEATRGANHYLPKIDALETRHLDAVEELLTGDLKKQAEGDIVALFERLADLTKGVSLTEDVTSQTKDQVLSFGERLSNLIIHYSFKERDIDAEFLDARDVIQTNSTYGNAIVNRDESFENIRKYFSEHPSMQCVTGFIGSTVSGKTTTLGRGGSDYTASLLAAALNADVLEIWTDVDGVLTADPRVVADAKLVEKLSYSEAMELSHFGAKVLYPPTIQPVREHGIPLIVRNTFNPSCAGSEITADPPTEKKPVTAISSISAVAVLTLQGSGLVGVLGSSGRLFASLAAKGVNVILISQASSECSICFAVLSDQADLAEEAVNQEFELEQQARRVQPVVVEKDCAIISVVGEGMSHLPGVAGTVFAALGRNRISIVAIAQGSSEENISLVVKSKDEPQAIRTIHRNFFERVRGASLVLIGPGQVGQALLKQIAPQVEEIREKQHYELKLVGVARSKKVLLNPKGLDWTEWQDDWEEKAVPHGNSEELAKQILSLRTPNLVVIDCTASDGFTPLYETLFHNNIPIVCANKKVQTEPFQTFERLRDLTIRKKVAWRSETSVGAALPIISTLQGLLTTGDSVTRIEALLSGSLSYAFYQLQQGVPFSQIISDSAEKGYLEPDPRDDLGGVDFARKLLILSRMLGHKVDLSEVEIDSLLSNELMEAPTVEKFMELLPNADSEFEEKTKAANSDNKRLRYIGSVDGITGEAEIKLQAVGADNPFYGLSGTDNLIAIYTERYSEQPLVVQGAGAGPEVTASGVFWDLMHVVQTSRELT